MILRSYLSIAALACLPLSSFAFAENASPATAADLSNSQAQIKAAIFDNDTQKSTLQNYITGREFCAKFADVTSHENSFEVIVPVDYQNPEKGQTRIWAFFTSGPYNPQLPTVVIIDGGPGGNSHGWPRVLKNYNELHFDQRGIGCSHPETLAIYRDPNFYSNMNNVRDIDELRKYLKINQISVYGASYGTAVATMYAATFAAHTKAVVLDGTELTGDDASDTGMIAFYLRKMYAQLPADTQAAMHSYFRSPEQKFSIYILARITMYSSDAFEQIGEALKTVFPSPDHIDTAHADKLFKSDLFAQTFFSDTVDAVEAFNNKVLNCKNFHQRRVIKAAGFIASDLATEDFATESVMDDDTPVCDAIGSKEDATIYSADHYPFSAPVTYFQGNWDGATFAAGAMIHYKTVPKGAKQLFIAKKGGHCPSLAMLLDKSDANSPAREVQIEVVENALSGHMSNANEIKRMNTAAQANAQNKIQWVYTSKENRTALIGK